MVIFRYFFALVLTIPLSSFLVLLILHSIYSVLDQLILNPSNSKASFQASKLTSSLKQCHLQIICTMRLYPEHI